MQSMAYDKCKNVYCIGRFEDDIKGAKLLSNEQVLCFFHTFLHLS